MGNCNDKEEMYHPVVPHESDHNVAQHCGHF